MTLLGFRRARLLRSVTLFLIALLARPQPIAQRRDAANRAAAAAGRLSGFRRHAPAPVREPGIRGPGCLGIADGSVAQSAAPIDAAPRAARLPNSDFSTCPPPRRDVPDCLRRARDRDLTRRVVRQQQLLAECPAAPAFRAMRAGRSRFTGRGQRRSAEQAYAERLRTATERWDIPT